MKKRILSLALVIAMIAIMLTSFTMAYFTDSEKATNTFTVGDIDIELTEVAKVLSEDGTVEYTDKCAANNDGGYTYSNLMPGNQIVKAPTIKNVSENGNAAYVRVVVTLNNAIALNRAIDDVYEVAGYNPADVQEVYDKVFDGWGINYNPRGRTEPDDARGIIDNRADGKTLLAVDFTKTTPPAGHSIFGLNNFFKSEDEENNAGPDPYEVIGTAGYVGYYTNGMVDDQIRYVFYLYLEKDESYTLFNGLNVPAYFDNNATDKDGNPVDQMAFFDGLTISIKADAIQAESFADAKAAFEALQAAHPIA